MEAIRMDSRSIARLDGPNMSYYHFDQLGSTRLLTNTVGTVTDEYTYDAYGAVLSHNRSAGSVDQPYQYVGQYGYYAHYMEPGVGLLQLGVGRITQRNQISSESDLSSYAYVGKTLLVSTASSGQFKDAPPSDCEYYDEQCKKGLIMACAMAPICRAFGDTPRQNCMRGCLIDKYKDCARKRGSARKLCEINYLGPGHIDCLKTCLNRCAR